MDLSNLKKISITKLIEYAKTCNVTNYINLKKNELIFEIIQKYIENSKDVFTTGVLEILIDGFGFLRFLSNSYSTSTDDVYVSPSQIRKFFLRTGDVVKGKIRLPRMNEKYYTLITIEKVNDIDPELIFLLISFENLTPIHVNKRFFFETSDNLISNTTTRIIDIITPLGKGQRALLVSPPKAGKTVMLQNIAKSLAINNPEVHLMVLLIDERPEEVTEMRRLVLGDVIYSTFDEHVRKHIQVAEVVIERARRLVELKKDVVILLDSITRLARAYNSIIISSGKVLTGGIDVNALQRPKFFFGSARNIEEGGSLTIIATALIDTGSKMDSVIFEEFKGTGNSEIHLDCKISEKRIYPSINVTRSSTRREELLFEPKILNKVCILRKILHTMEDYKATEFLIKHVRGARNNVTFFDSMTKVNKI
jgi:transcription termination factor Rho